MPIYSYTCLKCGARFERVLRFDAPPPDKCPQCDGQVKRVYTPPVIIFKGHGFYVNDSKSQHA